MLEEHLLRRFRKSSIRLQNSETIRQYLDLNIDISSHCSYKNLHLVTFAPLNIVNNDINF